MSNVNIGKGPLHGEVRIPPSKSAAHRAIICASLSHGTSVVSPIDLSADIRATIGAMEALGAKITRRGDTLSITGISRAPESAEIFCGESGSTLRFMIPIAAALGVNAVFSGAGRLPKRPIGEYVRLLPCHGVDCRTEGGLPFEIKGRLRGGVFEVNGNVSSQYITGLLLALPLIGEKSEIRLLTPLESAGYVDMTVEIMASFGVEVKKCDGGYIVDGSYSPADFTVEGDWSQAAFYVAAGAVGGSVGLFGLRRDTFQRDSLCADIIGKMGGNVQWQGDILTVRAGELTGIEIDGKDIPDIVPVLAVAAAFARGDTLINNVGRLRVKESDRLSAVAEGLAAMGVDTDVSDDSIVIHGGRPHGGNIDGHNDHRIVMAFSVAGSAVGGVEISDAESIEKSYPEFFEDFTGLGGIANGLDMG